MHVELLNRVSPSSRAASPQRELAAVPTHSWSACKVASYGIGEDAQQSNPVCARCSTQSGQQVHQSWSSGVRRAGARLGGLLDIRVGCAAEGRGWPAVTNLKCTSQTHTDQTSCEVTSAAGHNSQTSGSSKADATVHSTASRCANRPSNTLPVMPHTVRDIA